MNLRCSTAELLRCVVSSKGGTWPGIWELHNSSSWGAGYKLLSLLCQCVNEPEGLGERTNSFPRNPREDYPEPLFLMWKDLSTTDVWAAWKMSPDFQGNGHVLLRNVLLEHPVWIQGTNPAFLDKASDHHSRMHLINSQCNWPSRSLWIISLISSCAGKVFKIHHLTSLKSLTPNPLKINRNPGGFSEFSLRSPQMWTGNKTSEWK